jgi:hypothetical protein
MRRTVTEHLLLGDAREWSSGLLIFYQFSPSVPLPVAFVSVDIHRETVLLSNAFFVRLNQDTYLPHSIQYGFFYAAHWIHWIPKPGFQKPLHLTS